MKSEIRNPKAERNPKPERGSDGAAWNSDFGFRPSFGIRHSSFVIFLLLLHLSPLHAQPAAPNYVLSLGGTNGFLELPSGAFNDLEEVTLEGWVKWMDDRPWRRFFDFGKERRGVFVTRLESSPHITFTIPPPGGVGNVTRLVASDLFRTNQWIHLAAVIARIVPDSTSTGTRGFRPEPDTLQPPSARRAQSPGARQL